MESTIELESAFSTLMDAAQDAFAIVESDTGKFVAINDSHVRLFGLSIDELNTLGLGKFFGMSNTSKTLQQLHQVSTFEIFNCNVANSTGTSVNVELSCSPLKLQDKDYLLLVSKPGSDNTNPFVSSGLISIEQAFKDSEAKWQSITENSPDHIMLIDVNGNILFINHTVADLSVDQVIGKSCYDFVNPEQAALLRENYKLVIDTGKPVQFEIDYSIDDEIVCLENRAGPVFREGQVVALIVSSRDITVRKKVLKQLEKSQQHLRHALNAGRTGTWEWDIATNRVTWSDGVEALFGMEEGSFKGSYDSFRSVVHQDDIAMVENAIGETLSNDAPYYVEYRCVHPDGSIRWLNSQGEVYRDDEGNPLQMMGTVTDITQRKEAEEVMRQQEFLLSKSQEIAHIGSYIWDIKTNTFAWSNEMHRIFGISRENFSSNGADIIQKAIHPEDQQNVFEAQDFVIREKKPHPMEFRIVHQDGSIRYVWANGFLNFDEKGEIVSMIGTVQDITDRKKAEAALNESQQKLALHFQKTPLGVIDWNTNLEVTEWNPAAETIFGYTREEAMGRSAFGLIVDENIRAEIDVVWQSLMENAGGQKHTNENITKDGKTIICEWYNTVIMDDQGEVIGVSALVQDITDRVTTHKELEKHQQHLEELVADRTEEIREQALILGQIHDSIVTVDLNGIVTSWNHGAERMTGYTAEEAVGRHISFVHPEEERALVNEKFVEPLKEKGAFDVEVLLERKTGEQFWAHLSLSVRYDGRGNPVGMVSYSMDITDRKNAEEKILQQQKALEMANKELESFSYSVSHDLRSPLRAIDGFSAAILDDYYALLDDEGKENFQRIRNNAQRMAELIDDLLELSRVARHEFKREPVSLSLLVSDVVQKYKYVNPDRSVEVRIEDDLSVNGDAGLLRIALDNLISNAWKYTSKNKAAKIEFYQTKANDYSAFCIKDNGVGFDMRYVDKLFGAFQRLHGPEEFSGNGIGLATVSRIINRHGGKIWAEGSVNEGAKFFFTLND